jgi:hypothetical protein
VVKYLPKIRVILALLLIASLMILLISACNIIGLGGAQEAPPGPSSSAILAPPAGVKVLARTLVQIQSSHPGDSVSRVELWVQEPGQNDKLLRSDVPINGIVLQEWIPQQAGIHVIKVRTFYVGDQPPTELSQQIEVIDGSAIVLVDVDEVREWPLREGEQVLAEGELPPGEREQVPGVGVEGERPPGEVEQVPGVEGGPPPGEREQAPGEVAPGFEPPTATPLPGAVEGGAPGQIGVEEGAPGQVGVEEGTPDQIGVEEGAPDQLRIAVVDAEVEEPTPVPTSVPHYPPPPAAPGVPPGPVQADMPDFFPPVCDAAKSLGVYVPDTSRRVSIDEPDDVPAKAVGGSMVHRAWQLQNVGTCTWGPGYELAFYGGRSMGSGGVAFEAPFPSEPGRRNAIVDNNRLIVPEGKPNQVAVVEVLLNVPVTPGIHQSYWRMRNPQGIYFGPIIGVTLEVARTCEFGIYGAPVVNKFEILGVGNVFRPEDPVNVLAKFGEPVTLEWDIINATNFNIVIKDPTGNIQSTSTPDQSGRVTFTPKTLGRHAVILYADNGPCTVSAQVNVDVVPPDDEQFRLDLILSGAASAASTDEHISYSANVAPGSVQIQWKHFDQETDQFILIAEVYKRVYAEQCPIVDSIFGWKGHCYEAWGKWERIDQKTLTVGGEGDAQSAKTVSNIERSLCPASYDPEKEEYGLRYTLQAYKDGQAARPPRSNTVDVRCSPSSAPSDQLKGPETEFKPTE